MSLTSRGVAAASALGRPLRQLKAGRFYEHGSQTLGWRRLHSPSLAYGRQFNTWPLLQSGARTFSTKKGRTSREATPFAFAFE
jgi:hypothetical protein